MELNERHSRSDEAREDGVEAYKVDDSRLGTEEPPESLVWISGWRLVAIALGQALALFMVQAESSITSTAITAITDSLGDFGKNSWVFTAYLATYSAFPILLAKVSDILGRKQVLLSCIVVFVAFSGACGAAQSLVQLIMFRWIKGIGAGGIASICVGYGFELRPPEKWPTYSAFLTLTAAISLAIAPLLGAALTQAGQWRWCFLINVPIGVIALTLMFFAMPNKLRLEPAAQYDKPESGSQRLKDLAKMDYVGALLFVGASVLLLVALQQAAEGIAFTSPRVLVTLILAPISSICFVSWQHYIANHHRHLQSILPWELITGRVFLAVLCNAWLSGVVLTTVIFQVPQRYMLVNHLAILDAGLRLLPFTAVMALSSVLVAVLMNKIQVPAVYTLLAGALFQVIGVVGLSQASTRPEIDPAQYGFEVFAGVGVGIFNVILILLAPRIVQKQHLAVGNGAINQFRILGGSLGLSIVTCATNRSLRAGLLGVVGLTETASILDRSDRIFKLPPDLQLRVREVFGYTYRTQVTILIGIAVAQVFVTALQWQRKAVILKK